MKAQVSWVNEKTFVGQTESGHAIVTGNATDDSPKPGPQAMELVLIGVGTCSAYDVVEILKKGRQNIYDVAVEMDADRAEAVPKVFTRIHMHYVVKGKDISEGRVARAVELSVEKYCSATAMMAQTAEVSHSFCLLYTSPSPRDA